MKSISGLITALSGLAVAPFLVKLVSDFFGDAYPWIPFLIILLIALVLFAVGVEILQGLAAGMILGIIALSVLLIWFPSNTGFLPYDIRQLEPPF